MEQKINANQVLSTFDKAIDTLEQNLDPELFTPKEQINIEASLNDVIRLGLKVKFQYQQRKIDSLIQSLDTNPDVDLIKLQLMSNELDKILNRNEAA